MDIIHRNLKPGNILYNKNDDGKINWKISNFRASVKKNSRN